MRALLTYKVSVTADKLRENPSNWFSGKDSKPFQDVQEKVIVVSVEEKSMRELRL